MGAIVLWPFLGFVVRRDDGAVGLRGLRVPCAIVWGSGKGEAEVRFFGREWIAQAHKEKRGLVN